MVAVVFVVGHVQNSRQHAPAPISAKGTKQINGKMEK
jgi:hypothetical protein